jgi:hypothetical protein
MTAKPRQAQPARNPNRTERPRTGFRFGPFFATPNRKRRKARWPLPMYIYALASFTHRGLPFCAFGRYISLETGPDRTRRSSSRDAHAARARGSQLARRALSFVSAMRRTVLTLSGHSKEWGPRGCCRKSNYRPSGLSGGLLQFGHCQGTLGHAT